MIIYTNCNDFENDDDFLLTRAYLIYLECRKRTKAI